MKFPSVGWAEMKSRLKYTAIRGYTDQNGRPIANWYLWFFEETNYGERERTENVEFRHGISLSWVRNESPRASTSSYAGGIQALFYGADMARVL